MAGAFETVLGVPSNPAAVREAIVWVAPRGERMAMIA